MSTLNNGTQQTLVKVEGLKKHFPLSSSFFTGKGGEVRAVDGVNLEILEGETLGLVGESGCGKSTLGRTILQLHRPTEGNVYFEGQDLVTMEGSELRRMRSHMQIVFQDPYSSLNPRMTVREIVGEPLEIHNVAHGKARKERVNELLERVGLNPQMASRYPHEFSGGQRQRIGVARALALNPSFIVADEPISALDVSIQAQVVNLLLDLQKELNLTYLFITHDLSMVRYICDRVAVMYLGKIVELGSVDEIYENPQHPYTQALLSAVPVPDPIVEEKRRRIILEGDVPSPAHPPEGCNFNSRCPLAFDRCMKTDPDLKEQLPGHYVACYAVEESIRTQL
ncbi:MAG: dipeptide ABC transporter ATP-binding protein [Anaerolineales bacterium]|nr:dipeptide ABC transporter ATP-binding protein [Anaerolineales bacterium]